jgi:hypothetical protein
MAEIRDELTNENWSDAIHTAYKGKVKNGKIYRETKFKN